MCYAKVTSLSRENIIWLLAGNQQKLQDVSASSQEIVLCITPCKMTLSPILHFFVWVQETRHKVLVCAYLRLTKILVFHLDVGVLAQHTAAVHASASSITISACALSACCFQISCTFGLTSIHMEWDFLPGNTLWAIMWGILFQKIHRNACRMLLIGTISILKVACVAEWFLLWTVIWLIGVCVLCVTM